MGLGKIILYLNTEMFYTNIIETFNLNTYFCLIDFPKDGPKISTIPLGRNEYRVGDTAHLMCKAQKSSPPTELSWYINGEPVSIPLSCYLT